MPPLAIAAEAPPGWVEADVPRPQLSESTGATWTTFHAWRSPDDDAAMSAGCAGAPIPGWVEDMRPSISGRTVALAGAAAERIVGHPVETGDGSEGALVIREVGGGPTIGNARTFLGFEGSNVESCFVVCAARKSPNAASSACNEVVVHASLSGSDPAPRPSLVLRAVTWAVHHPSGSAAGFAVVTVLAGMLAIATRRKPRSRG